MVDTYYYIFPSIINVFALIALFIFIYAILGMHLFSFIPIKVIIFDFLFVNIINQPYESGAYPQAITDFSSFG